MPRKGHGFSTFGMNAFFGNLLGMTVAREHDLS